MIDWNSFLQQRLLRIENLEARRLLHQYANGPFLDIANYFDKKYQSIEDEVLQAVPAGPLESYGIAVGLCAKADYALGCDGFFPLLPAELEPPAYQAEQLLAATSDGQAVAIATVFCAGDAKTLQDMVDRLQSYRGLMITNKQEHPISLTVRPSQLYRNVIARLYRVFQYNRLPWRTVNCPYAYKFLDVMLSGPLPLEPEETIRHFSFDFGSYQSYCREDSLLVWNVQPISIQGDFCQAAAERPGYFNAEIRLTNLGLEHGYLLDLDQDAVDIRRHDTTITVMTAAEKPRRWDFLKLWQPAPTPPTWLREPVFTNCQTDSFANRLASRAPSPIRTVGEIRRLVISFTAAAFTVIDVAIEPPTTEPPAPWLATDLNTFISDELRDNSRHETMRIRFQATQPPTFTTTEELSFLVSEIQQRFPEYRCIGELL